MTSSYYEMKHRLYSEMLKFFRDHVSKGEKLKITKILSELSKRGIFIGQKTVEKNIMLINSDFNDEDAELVVYEYGVWHLKNITLEQGDYV